MMNRRLFASRFWKGGCFLLAAVLPISIALSNMVLAAIFLVWLTVWLRVGLSESRWEWRRMGIESAVFLFLIVMMVSGLLSENIGKSFHRWIGFLLVLISVPLAQTISLNIGDRCLKVFCWSTVAVAVLGLAQFLIGIDVNSDSHELVRPDRLANWPHSLLSFLALWNGRSVGTRSHPLTYAEGLLLAFPLLLERVIRGRFFRRGVWSLGSVLVCLAILTSQSRGVWLGMMAVLVGWMVLRASRRVLFFAGLFVLLGVSVFLAEQRLHQRFSSIFRVEGEASNMIRIGLWESGWEEVKKHPWFGMGPGNVALKPSSRWAEFIPEPERVWSELHNVFFQEGVEGGGIGLVVFLVLIYSMGRIFWKSGREWNVGLFLGLVGLLVAGMTESWYNDSEIVLSLYFLVGCSVALRYSEKTENAP